MKKLGFDAKTLISTKDQVPKKKDSYFQGSLTNLLGSGEITEIPIDSITSIDNPRKNFNFTGIKELAASIEAHGLLQPITVRKKGEKYDLIAGERRLRAYQFLKRKTIPGIVKNVEQINPENLTEIKLIENIQREDLSDLEIALTLSTLKERKKTTNEELAIKINKTEGWVKAKIAHVATLETLIKKGSLTNLNLFQEIPTSVWVELSSSVKENPKAVENWLNSHFHKKEIPKQAEARIFAKGLKSAKLKKNKNSKTESLEYLQKQEEELAEKIKKLQKKRKTLLAKIALIENS